MSLFNTKGPKVVTVETFRIYQNLRPENGDRCWTVETLFKYAADESHPTALRLLAWRDLLFQNKFIEPEAADYYHPTGQSYDQILHIDGGFEDGKVLRETLRGRPKLIREFSAQLEYNLRHDLMHREYYRQSNDFRDPCDGIIEILLPLVSEAMAHKLWKYHQCSTVRPKYDYQTYCRYAALCLPSAKMPEWLTTQLWSTLTDTAKTDCTNHNSPSTATHLILHDQPFSESYSAAAALSYQLHCFNPEKSTDLDLITKYIQTLEHILPQNFLYFDFHDLTHYAPVVKDELATVRLLQRHLPPLADPDFVHKYPRTYIQEDENFLRWAYGTINLSSCNLHQSQITDLSTSISRLHHAAKSSNDFRVY